MEGRQDDGRLVIARSDHTFLTLNEFPYNYGHVMVLPYAHVPSQENLDTETLTDLLRMTYRAMRVLRELARPSGFNIAANIGQAAGAGIAKAIIFMGLTADTRLIPASLA